MRWAIKPRYDKSLPELEFQMKNSIVTREYADKFMSSFDIDIDVFEEELDETLADLVDIFFER